MTLTNQCTFQIIYLLTPFWWFNTIDKSTHRIKDDIYTIEIFSDASTTGWGGVCNGQVASGQWSKSEAVQHINSGASVADTAIVSYLYQFTSVRPHNI